MSLLDDLTRWIDRDRQSLTYTRIDASHVDRPLPEQTLQAGVHYIRLRLASMFLKKETRWFSSWYPAVHSIVRFNFGDRTIEVPNIADVTGTFASIELTALQKAMGATERMPAGQ
jgi:hypothetical protein